MNGANLLALQFRTIFETTESGRILRTSDPDRSPGPLFWLAGGDTGNIWGVRADVPDEIAHEIAALAGSEPPFVDRDEPQNLARYVALLTRDGAVPGFIPGMVYELPRNLRASPMAMTVDSESAEGRRLYQKLSVEGMPAGLLEMGFRNAAEFWDPWCAVLNEGVPVSVCFAARLSDGAAEAGVATARYYRGRGYAAAAVAGWSRLDAFRSRALFYSTDRTNISSQRVASRLGLRRIGNRMTLV